MPTSSGPGDADPQQRRDHRHAVRSELDLLGVGITSLLADEPCYYSPLVLVGSPAATTAVLQEIRHHWKGLHRDTARGSRRLLFIDAKRLCRDLDAAAGESLDSVHQRWTSADLVVIDGIAQLVEDHHLASLPHLLDRVLETGSRMVCSLAQEHGKRSQLPEAITSRLGEGLVVTVRSTEPTATTVGPAMGRPAPSVRRILSASARHFGLTNDDLIGSSRRRTVALARGIAMYLARQFCGESLAAIGRRFSGRDHTTVMHAIRVTQERIQRDPAVAADVDAILTTLGCETNPGSQDA
ncbi:MAG: hypothetical protein ISQ07_00785 [Pirellulales bacterium]|nr:hypothetical protein [Pirellulales bacterium]